jgi:hypothetical protein
MPFAFQNYDVWYNAVGAYGFNTFNTNSYGVSAAGLANSWVHNAAIFNNGTTNQNSLYLNGNVQTLSYLLGAAGSRTVTAEAAIGTCEQPCGGGTIYPFAGQIDDVRIYNRALSATEIAELYRMDTTSTVTFTGFLNAAP